MSNFFLLRYQHGTRLRMAKQVLQYHGTPRMFVRVVCASIDHLTHRTDERRLTAKYSPARYSSTLLVPPAELWPFEAGVSTPGLRESGGGAHIKTIGLTLVHVEYTCTYTHTYMYQWYVCVRKEKKREGAPSTAPALASPNYSG